MKEPTQRPTAPSGRRPFLDALVDDPRAATSMLLAAIARGRFTAQDAVLKVLASAAAESGERWARGEWDVPTASLAALAVEDAAVTVSHAHGGTPRTDGCVVIAPAAGDAHALPSRLFGTALALRGWDVRVLTSPLPAADLTAYLADLRPRALLVTATVRAHLPGAAHWAAAAHEAGTTVVAGGAAFGMSPRRAAVLGADAWASSVDGCERILATQRAPRRPARGVSDLAAVLSDSDPLLSEAWSATLRAEHDAARAAWLSQWVPLVLRSARAAALTDDDDIFMEDLAWLAGVTAERFDDPDLVPAMLAPLRRLLPTSDVRLHRLVAKAFERLNEAPAQTASVPDVAAALRAHPAAAHGREAVYDELAFVASVMCGAELGVVAVSAGDRMVVKGAHGVEATDYPADVAWTVETATGDAASSLPAHPFVRRHGAAFVLQVPLRDGEGQPFGVVVVGDGRPRAATWPQRQGLRSLARQVEARLGAGGEPPRLVILDGEALGAVPAGLRPTVGARGDDDLLRTAQVAKLFHVSPRTVNNWVAQGRLSAIATAGGHKRYRLGDVLALYREQGGAEGETNAH